MKLKNEWGQIIRKVVKGDKNAFEELYRRTSKRVWFLCNNYLRNEHDAKDVMQEAYLSAWQHIGELHEPERFSCWIERIAANKCHDFVKKRNPVPVEDEVFESEEESDELVLPEAYLRNAERRRILMHILKENLTVIQYQTVILYYFMSLSVQEVSGIMECREGTVKSRLSAARNRIRTGVEKYETQNNDSFYGAVPFLTLFLNEEAMNIAASEIPALIFAVGAKSSGISATGTAAISSVKLKAIAIVAAAMTASGGTAALVHFSKQDDMANIQQAALHTETTVFRTEASVKGTLDGAHSETSTITTAVFTITATTALTITETTAALTTTSEARAEKQTETDCAFTETQINLSKDITETSVTEEEIPDFIEPYKKVYCDVVIAYMEEYTDLLYELTDIDSNGMPELVINAPNYWQSIYTYDGNSLFTIIERQSYGTYGNWGYDYVPGSNRLRYHINEGIGSVSYMIYMKLTPEYTLEITDKLKLINAIDYNENGRYDDDEWLEEPVYTLNNAEITAEEYNAYYYGETFNSLWGSMTGEEMVSALEQNT